MALAALVFAAVETFQDFQFFQQQNTYAANSDVRSIRPWMTIPYIARFYHVPESYLYSTLHISSSALPRHTPLRLLASHYNRSVDELIQSIQTAIQTYRKQHAEERTTNGVVLAATRSSGISGAPQLFARMVRCNNMGCTNKNVTLAQKTARFTV